MLIGMGELDALAKGAPTMEKLDPEALNLPGARVLQVLCEIDSASMCAMLPPALHPTLPPAVSWLVYDCPDTPWGPTRLAQTRIECRSGTRPRGLLISAVCSNPAAGRALADGWGYRSQPGEIEFRRSYDEIRSVVHVGGEAVLEIGLREPSSLAAGDIQFVAGMHPVHTPRGFRLLQCDPTHAEAEAERGIPVVENFDAEIWGDDRIEPVYPVSAAYCTADITLPNLRYLCKPDELAFTGTEKI